MSAAVSSDTTQKVPAQPVQPAKMAELAREETENTARKSDTFIAKYAMADLLIIDQAIASAKEYIVKNPTADQKTIEKGLVQYNSVIEHVKSTLIPRTFLGYLSIELPAFATAGAAESIKFSATDKSAARSVGAKALKYLEKVRQKNTTPVKEYFSTCVALIKEIIAAIPAMKNLVEGSLLSAPFFNDVKNAYLSDFQGAGGEAADENLVGIASAVFVTSFMVGIVIALFMLGGSLAANSVIWRPAGYRILYFIWGGLAFIATIPYYLVYMNFIRDRPPHFFAGAIPLIAVDKSVATAMEPAQSQEENFIWSMILFPWRIFKGAFGWISPLLFEYTKDDVYNSYIASAAADWTTEEVAVAGGSSTA